MTTTEKRIPKSVATQLDRLIWRLEAIQQKLPLDSEIDTRMNRAKSDLRDVLEKIRESSR